MAKKSARSDNSTNLRRRYEFRVWGEYTKARKKLERMADERTHERYEDCYLLVDDLEWNAKVRDNTLKIKQLVSERKGFERWESGRHRTAKSTPTPFDEIFETLRLDRPQRGKRFDITKAVKRLDPDSGVRAVFVRKDRRRYRVGDLLAEVTDIRILDDGTTLHTISIEGDDLPSLVELRKRLGLKGEDNLAVHQAIDAASA